MEAQRELQILRAIVKDGLRQKGIQFDQDIRRCGASDVKKMNSRYKTNPPILPSELGEVVLPLIEELTDEHVESLKTLLNDLKAKGQ